MVGSAPHMVFDAYFNFNIIVCRVVLVEGLDLVGEVVALEVVLHQARASLKRNSLVVFAG